ncbi:phospholipase A2 inhibitor and Ly6/PLAUR domain-containing protein-like [Rhineura floridana]|uniref:phospholipase A2 inhibitor and Ly6/PLAUR domain-containing protein-like n=1 Tax=Rhineura floridana TaxID=261503 RepID=UPI002AC7EA8E|nr:phospholipase A2 inhibitor and Ly6/PLAUR domain-containing protein-like [Rhineura floridana]
MQVCLRICLLSALIVRGTALQCEVCTGVGHNCSGDLVTCPQDHDFCGITLFQSEREDVKVNGIVKNCVPSNVCEAGSADINLGKKGRSRTKVSCCKSDACNTASPANLPLLDTKLNGLQCPACYALFNDSCSDETVDCVGSESQCIDLAGYIHLGESSEKVAMKGCATHAVCTASVGGAATFTGISSAITKLECAAAASPASMPLGPPGLLLSAIAGFLIIQLWS